MEFFRDWCVPTVVIVLFLAGWFWANRRVDKSYNYYPVDKEVIKKNRKQGARGIGYKKLVWNSKSRMLQSPDQGTLWAGRRMIAETDPFKYAQAGIHLRKDPYHSDLKEYQGDVWEVRYWGAVEYEYAVFATEAEAIRQVS